MQVFRNVVFLTGALGQNFTDGPVGRKFNRLVGMLNLRITTNLHPNAITDMIQNYGCHCIPTRGNLGGAGPAQDDYDKVCRDLSRCYRCLGRDFNGYDSGNNYRYDVDVNNDISCNSVQNDDPMKALCECDRAYAYAMGAVWDDNTFDYTLWKQKKNSLFNFDHDTVCVRQTGVETDDCCGQYPDRKPYSTLANSCCGDQVMPFGTC